jgi:hypothetical protein
MHLMPEPSVTSTAWIELTPEQLSAARKRLADARTAHDHAKGVGCREYEAAYDELARVREPMKLTDPAPLPAGTEMWNRPGWFPRS